MAKESMEKLISKKGMDLIKEWGIMSRKAKSIKDQNSPMKNSALRPGKSHTPKVSTRVGDVFGASFGKAKVGWVLNKF